MPQIRYLVGGVENVETIPDALVDYYQARLGYTVVVSEEDASELKGDDLDQAARELAGVTDPGHTPAAEKRALIVEATAPTGDGLEPPYKPSEAEQAAHEAEKYGTPDPEPATKPAGKRRTAADSEE